MSTIAAKSFIAAPQFQGRKPGFYFSNGEKGVGYYLDPKQSEQQQKTSHQAPAPVERKRKFEDVVVEGEEDTKPSSSSRGAEVDIDELLEQADQTDIAHLDAAGVKQLLVNLEKKINKNQKMRMKHADEHEKFMESEFELHKEIEDMHVVAAFPELYPVLLQNDAVNTLFGLLTHENTDISIATISLLQEMTETDALLEQAHVAKDFVSAIAKVQGFELLVQNLARLDETNNEDAQGVHNTLAIFENLLEIQPELSVSLCEKTHLLRFLLNRVRNKKFDANKLYCSEILSILMQSDAKNTRALVRLPAEDEKSPQDGLEILLQSISVYRKKDVDIADEKECVENLFLCLCTVLMQKEHQDKFIDLEGFELMMRCLQEQQYAAGCVLNAVNYAITKNAQCCARFVDVGGLKYVFPVLMGKGLKKSLKKKGSGEKRDLEQSAISIIAQLCMQLFHSTNTDYRARLALKMKETDCEKLRYCCELFDKYLKMLEATEAKIESTRRRLIAEGDEEALEEFLDEDNIYLQRLDGGLFMLQQVTIIIAFACHLDKSCLAKVEEKLGSSELRLLDLLGVLRDLIENIGEDSAIGAGENVSQDVGSGSKAVLQEWCHSIASFVSR